MATKVKLRTKAISGNRLSLYLDFYPAIIHPETGVETRREFLNRYLFSEIEMEEQKYTDKNGREQKRIVEVLDKKGQPKKVILSQVYKQHNKETLYWAEQVRQKTDTYVNKAEIYTSFEKEQLKIANQGEQSFSEYFKKMANRRKGSNLNNWLSAIYYFDLFTDGSIKFAEVDEQFCEDYREYILIVPSKKEKNKTLAINSAKSYFDKFKATLKHAYKHGLFIKDLNIKIDSIKEEESHREFLDATELKYPFREPLDYFLISAA